MFVIQHYKYNHKRTRYYAERYQVLSEQVYSQYFYRCKSISVKGFSLEPFNRLKPSAVPIAQFHYRLSDERDQDTSTPVTNLRILFQFILTKNGSSILNSHGGLHG